MTRHLLRREKHVLYATGSVLIFLSTAMFLFWTYTIAAPKASSGFRQYTLAKNTNHLQRAEQIQRMCKYLQTRVQQVQYKDIEIRTQIYEVRNVSICVVPKSGCSFLKQTVYYLGDPEKLINTSSLSQFPEQVRKSFIRDLQKDIFHIMRRDVHSSVDFTPLRQSLSQFKDTTSLKVISARNPYSRLFSAYIDKVYIPTFDFLLKMKQEQWPSKLRTRQLCRSHYVTFEDFLKLIVEMSKNAVGDQHWLPVSSLCDPCNVKPDIIIKQETYYEDTLYALSKVKMTQTEWDNISSAVGKKGLQTDYYLRGLIKTMFFKGTSSSLKCFTEIQMAQRVWKALKIQGQIYKHLKFPTEKLLDEVTLNPDIVADIFMEEIPEMPITYEESREQRWRALTRAYRNIQPKVITDIQAMFYYDFILFGYDLNPPRYTES